MVKITCKDSAMMCIEYILETEYEDYFHWCKTEELDPNDLDNEHIYTTACKALGIKPENCTCC